jgi:predicted RND superfamily exporter protein
MQTYVNILDKFKWLIIIVIPLLVLLLSKNLQNLAFEGSYRIWFGEDSKILNDYDRFRKVFGSDDSIIITLKDDSKDGIFNPRTLSSINTITQQLWQTKHIARVDSIVNYQYIYADPQFPDEIIIEDFIQDIDSQNAAYFKERKTIALNDKQLNGSLISKDASTTMIVARMTPKTGENEDLSFEILDSVQAILKPQSEKTGLKFWLNGGAPLTTSFVTVAETEGALFTPLVVVSVILLLGLLFRNISGALIPISIVLMTSLVVMSIQVMLGYKLNNFTANIPIFIIAIGIADSVHIYIIWQLYKKRGENNKEAVIYTLEKNMLPIFLTSITTGAGFASLSISEVVPVATLGIATASGAFLAFIFSILFIPSLLLCFKDKKPIQSNKDITILQTAAVPIAHIEKKYLRYGDFIIKHDKKITFFSFIMFSFFFFGLFKVNIDSNTIRYFNEKEEIRQSTEFIMHNLTGPMSYEIVVDSGKKDGIKDPEFLKTVQKFYDDYQSRYPDVRHMRSLLDIIKQFNKVMNGNKETFYRVPDSQELAAQYLLLYTLSLPIGMEINDKMDIEERLLRVTAQVNLVDTSKDLEMIRWAQEWWKNNTRYSAQVNGQNAMFAYMQKSVTDTLIYSISIALMIVSLMMLLIFKNIKLLGLFLLPNILPVILAVGLMGWLNINIDLGVAVSAAIILGVAVDDTIHFFIKYFHAKKQGLADNQAFAYVVQYAGSAIVFTTIILSLSFSIFIFSSFNPNVYFGIITASALVIALIADLLMLPAMLSLVNKKNVHV